MINRIFLATLLIVATSGLAEARYGRHRHQRSVYRYGVIQRSVYPDQYRNPLASRYNSEPRRTYCSENAGASQFCP